MVWERFDGAPREVSWGELQDLANQAANVLRRRRRAARRPRRRRAAADPRDRGDVLRRPTRTRRCCCRCRCCTATRASVTASRTRAPRCWSPTAPTPTRFDPSLVDELLILDDGLLDGASTEFTDRRHRGRRPGPALLHVGHDRPRQGHRPRAPLPARPRGVHLLPRGPDGVRFHGMGEWAWAAGIAPLLGPWRLGAVQYVLQRQGGFDPHPAARLPVAPRGDARLHDADRDAVDDGDRGRRARATRRSSVACAAPASRSTRRRSAGSASSTG